MPDELSKSARKREAERLQKIGLKLTQLKPDARARLQLPDALRKAIDVHAGINSREGGRRQMQYIGKLMRSIDVQAIEEQLAALDGQSAAARHFFHTVEQWRDRLTMDANSLTGFIDQYPNVERQVLRQLVGAANKQKPAAEQEPTDAHRKAQRILFRFIRSTLTAHSDEYSSSDTS